MRLKQLKIKTRLIMLCIIPAIVVSAGAYLILSHLYLNSSGYRVAEKKIELINGSLSLNSSMYRLFTDRVEKGYWPENEIRKILDETQGILDNASLEGLLVEDSIDFSSLRELKFFVRQVDAVKNENINNSMQLWLALMYDALTSINRIKIPNGDAKLFYVNKNFESLSWFLYWVQKESWLINAIKFQPSVSDELRNDYVDAISRQKIYWDAFVNYAANDQQLQELNSLLTNGNFQKIRLFHTKILDGEIDNGLLTEGAILYENKVNSLMDLFSGYSVNELKNIRYQVRLSNYQIWGTGAVVLFILSILFYMSLSTSYRISGKLTRILNTVQKLRNKKDKVDLIEIEGDDEICQFAIGLNSIIVQLSEHEKNLINAREEAITANRAKSAFLANISHEIRTPLNGIIGLTEILTMQSLNAAQKDIVDDIDVSSQTLLVLINDILDLSKIESGKLSISPSLCNIREVIYDTVNLVSTKALSQLNELHIDIDAAVPIHVNCDGFRYKQILMNLLSNAVKFSHEGYVNTSLKYDEFDSMLVCSVVDTGIGIPNDRIETIFKPFHQGDSSITRRFGGTGLGLTICRELVELMGGKITVSSQEGKGSQFTFTIPVPKPEEESFEQFNIKSFLITNGSPYIEQIEHECELYGITIEKMNSVEELGQHESNTADCILYCTNVTKNDIAEINKLRIANPDKKILSLQHHLFVSRDVVNIADGNVILPFTGNKFISLLKSKINYRVGKSLNKSIETDNQTDYSHPLSKRILIVEDNLMNQKIAGFFLDKADFEYTVVNNGQEAVDVISQGAEYSAILMDCMMPVMDGLTATKKIREWEKANKKSPVPIVALTASVLDEDVVKCFDAGMDAYLPKPYKSEQLYEVFDKFKIS